MKKLTKIKDGEVVLELTGTDLNNIEIGYCFSFVPKSGGYHRTAEVTEITEDGFKTVEATYKLERV